MARRLSAAAIQARIRKLQKQAAKLERGVSKGIRAASKAISKHGLSLADLNQAFGMSRGRGKRGALVGRTVAVKYRDDAGNSWTGRGRTPLWLVAAEKAGKKRESFLVGANKARPKSAKPKKAARK